MDDEEGAILRLRADGLSYRQIAERLGIPLTRAYKLAQRAVEAEPEPLPTGAQAADGGAPEPPPTPPLLTYQTGYLTGPIRMPTREDLQRPYTLPGPNGTTIVIDPR